MKYISLKPVMIYISTFVIHMIYFNILFFFLFIRNKIIISGSRSQLIFCIRNIMSRCLSVPVTDFNINIFIILRVRCIIPSIILVICRKLWGSDRCFTAEICLFYRIIVIIIQTAVYFFYIAVRYRLTSGHNRKRIF